ncbi:MAG: gamma-glutamylcyclotransferase [Acetobacteraceae bacterium]|nr:gamma-glutamylcyclotransferase [Acetobacteraceae bacterium]
MMPNAAATLCFAYGSNLNWSDWMAWCGRNGVDPACLKPVGRALLPDMRLAFDYYSGSRGGGALNVVGEIGCVVEGVLLQVGPGGWDALDAKEGVSTNCYERRRRTAILPDGAAMPVAVYEVTVEHQEKFVPPTDEYVAIVQQGMRAHGIDPDPLHAAVAGSETTAPLRDVFAYGTLMRGEPLHHTISHATNMRAGSTIGRLHNMVHYPALLLGGEAPVAGELMTLSDPARGLVALDQVEDALPQGAPGGLYRRTVLRVSEGAGLRPAWAYVMDTVDPVACPLIPSGDWRRPAAEVVG